MSAPNQAPQLPQAVRNLAAVGAVALSVGAPAAAEASPLPADHGTPAEYGLKQTSQAPREYHPHGSHNEKLPHAEEQKIRKDVLFYDATQCSGLALRNNKGDFLGGVTADHCLTGAFTKRFQGTDGKTYIVQPKPMTAYTGAKSNKLRKAGEIEQVIVPATGDKSHDVALTVAAGVDPEAVLKQYKKEALSVKELSNLHVGQKVYLGGWPQQNGQGERQSFALNLTNFGPSGSSLKPTTEVLYGTASNTSDGAQPSFGDSGGVAFLKVHDRFRLIGPESVFYDTKGDVPGTATGDAHNPNQPQLKGKDIAGMFGFSYKLPGKNTMQVLHSVRSTAEIPGYISPEQAVANTRADIKAGKPVTYIDGEVQIYQMADLSAPVNNPIVQHDASGNNVFAWTDKDDPDHLHTVVVDNDSLQSDVTIYGHTANTPVQLRTTSTGVSYREPTGPSVISDPPVETTPPSTTPPVSMKSYTASAYEGKGGPVQEPAIDEGALVTQDGTSEIGSVITLRTPNYSAGFYRLVADASGLLTVSPVTGK